MRDRAASCRGTTARRPCTTGMRDSSAMYDQRRAISADAQRRARGRARSRQTTTTRAASDDGARRTARAGAGSSFIRPPPRATERAGRGSAASDCSCASPSSSRNRSERKRSTAAAIFFMCGITPWIHVTGAANGPCEIRSAQVMCRVLLSKGLRARGPPIALLPIPSRPLQLSRAARLPLVPRPAARRTVRHRAPDVRVDPSEGCDESVASSVWAVSCR